MPEYLVPGVYVEEVNTGPRPIEGVSTSTAAILGTTERGPMTPQLIGSWLEYQRLYGGYLPDAQSYVPYAVKGFFDNGGQRLFVARVAGFPAGQNAFAFANTNLGPLTVYALGPGSWGDRIFFALTNGSQTDRADYFRLTLLYFSADNLPPIANPLDPLNPANSSQPNYRQPDRIEDYDNVTMTPGAPNNIATVVNGGSQLVRVWDNGAGGAVPGIVAPQLRAYTALAAGTADGGQLSPNEYGGSTGSLVAAAPSSALFGQGWGLAALEAIDEVNLILAPDTVNANTNNGGQIALDIITQCETLRDRFAVLSVANNQQNAQLVPIPQDTTYAALYYPWIWVYDPLTRGPLLIPPVGHVAGIIARTDIERGVFKAPANEVVRGASGLEFPVTDAMQALLNPRGINCIRDFTSSGRGIRLWGARTLTSDPIWKYINVRRLFLFLEESIDQGTQWVVFEPNDEFLWAAVRRTIVSFLIGVWRSGALMGTTQDEAFFVKCDRTTMTTDDIENGRLVCLIGVAPVRPAEFVIFRISQKTLELQQQ
jgi:uncharacterized protein